jgi:UDP-glucose 4-epimerase
VILRVSNPFGERQRIETAQGAIGVFLDRALRGAEIEIWGDGAVTRDYLYVGDVADAFSKALRYTGSCSVFNVGSGTGTSLLQILAALEEVLGRRIRRKHLPGRPFDVPVNVLDNRLAGSELGWAPAVPLRDGLVKTAEWMKQQLANAAGPVLPGRP